LGKWQAEKGSYKEPAIKHPKKTEIEGRTVSTIY